MKKNMAALEGEVTSSLGEICRLQQWNRAKLVLVGAEFVGKTSLLVCLRCTTERRSKRFFYPKATKALRDFGKYYTLNTANSEASMLR